MTNPKPTEGWAIVAKDGRVVAATLSEELALGMRPWGATIIPVTIIPTADLVKEAARVLLEHLTDQKCAECDCNSGGIDCNWISSKIDGAALRALAGQGGE